MHYRHVGGLDCQANVQREVLHCRVQASNSGEPVVLGHHSRTVCVDQASFAPVDNHVVDLIADDGEVGLVRGRVDLEQAGVVAQVAEKRLHVLDI